MLAEFDNFSPLLFKEIINFNNFSFRKTKAERERATKENINNLLIFINVKIRKRYTVYYLRKIFYYEIISSLKMLVIDDLNQKSRLRCLTMTKKLGKEL